jgi:adenine/guanine/hypoxanthine permease
MQLKLAITAGIGLFILFIGLVDAGFIGSTGSPSPPVGLGSGGIGSINTVPAVVFVFTLLVTSILVVRRVRGGILIGLVIGTLVAVVIEAIWHLGAATERPAAGACRCRRCRDLRLPSPTYPLLVISASAVSVA